MAFIEWQSDYDTKLPDVDREHHTLVDMVNRLHAAMVAGTAHDVMQQTLADLLAYTKTHFANEERMMKQSGFPGFAAHKQLHDGLTAQVHDFVARHNAGRAAISIQLLQFLRKWLVEHIQNSDKRFAAHVRGRMGRSSSPELAMR